MMKKMILAALAAVSLLASTHTPAHATVSAGTKLKTIGPIQMARAGASPQDTFFVAGVADSLRSGLIDLSDMDWEPILRPGEPGAGSYSSKHAIMVRVVWNSGTVTDGSDTMVVNVEPTYDNGLTYILNNNYVAQGGPNTASTNLLRDVGVAPTTTLEAGKVQVNVGYLSPDFDFAALNGADPLFCTFIRKFRIRLSGEQADAFGGCKLYITYPVKNISTAGGLSPVDLGVRIRSRTLSFVEPGQSAYTDTTFIQDENDSVRTAPISMPDFDNPMLFGSGATLISGTVAKLVVQCRDGWWVGDSLRANAEFSMDGGTTWTFDNSYTGATGTWLFMTTRAITAGPAEWEGTFRYDGDIQAATQNTGFFGCGDCLVRFRITGDQGGTNPKAANCVAYLLYPARQFGY